MRAWLVIVVLFAGCLGSAPADEQADSAGIVIDTSMPPSQEEAPAQETAPPADEGATVRSKQISDEQYEWEPSGAIDPTDGDHYVVAYRSSSHASMSVRTTFDGGHSWEYAEVPITASSGPAAQWGHNGDPVVFFSPEGDLYIGGIGGRDWEIGELGQQTRYGRSIFIVASDDGGMSFTEPTVIALGGGTITSSNGIEHWQDFINQDRPWFAAGAGGTLIAAWNELGHDGERVVAAGQSTAAYDGNEFQYSISRDHGATWSDPETLGEGGWPGALVRADGSFVLGHSSHITGKLSIFTSADGADWERTELGVGLDAAMLTEYQGDLLVSTSSLLGGRTAPAYYRVGDDVTGPFIYAVGQDLRPSNHLGVDPNGGFWSMWLGGNGTVNLAKFTDDAAPWPSERHVIAEIDPTLGAYGDYVYTLGVGPRLYTVWNDIVGDDRDLFVSVY